MEIYEPYKRADMIDYTKLSEKSPVKDEIDEVNNNADA